MSFLSALGAAATPLLQWGGGKLLDKVKPWWNKATTWFSNFLGGDKTGLGKNVGAHLIEKGLNATLGGLQKFGIADQLQRKMPIQASMLGRGLDIIHEYKNRLGGDGYVNKDITLKPTYQLDGIEKMRD